MLHLARPFVSMARGALGALVVPLLGGAAAAQTFQLAPHKIPQGAPFNASYTENLDCADVDLDGDWDLLFADGGDFGNDQNRLWINLGGAQGGTPGTFEDRTSTRLPAVIDDSRDVDFADVDHDGDPDAFVSNTSQISNQSNRWLINMGGAQGGVAGFFTEQTATRWVALGVNNAIHHSSLAPSVVLVAGGFIDWSGDSAFADLDGDGALDLVQSTYGALSGGNVPARVFLNDGQGRFEEFNPSGYQLSGAELPEGVPALWALGTQQHQTGSASGAFADVATVGMSLELGDLDGDLDLDVLLGDKTFSPRVFRNLGEQGTLALRDVTGATLPAAWTQGAGKYEQVLGDLDDDGDLDVYGVNWIDEFCDAVLTNDGTGAFAIAEVDSSCQRESEPDLVDYDDDGDLDVFLTRLSYPERMQRNSGASGGFVLAPAPGALPPTASHSWGADVCDVDGDGDYDALVANDLNEPNELLDNVAQLHDSFAPRIPRVEQAPDRVAGAQPTVVRAQVYDNAELYLTAWATVTLEYAVGGGAFTAAPMRWSGAQVFRGEIPGDLIGAVDYRVVARDAYGNTGVSLARAFVAACGPAPLAYCTAKTNSCGGSPAISAAGTPSASASSGFVVRCDGAREGKQGLLMYTPNGAASVPFQGGTLCIETQGGRRGPALYAVGGSGGANCDAALELDLNAFAAGLSGGNPAPFLRDVGQRVHVQWWGRDSLAHGSLLSDALEYGVCP